MMRLSLALLLFSSLWAAPCWATQQVIVNGANDDLPVSATEYASLWARAPTGSGNPEWHSTEFSREGLVSAAGTLSNLRVEVTTAPGSGKSFTFTVRVNSTNSALSCQIADLLTSCTDSDNVSVAAGDAVALQVVPAGSPATSGNNARWTLTFNSTKTNQTLLMGGSGGTDLDASASRYIPALGHSSLGTTGEGDRELLAPTSGTLRNLYVELNAAPVQRYDFYVRRCDPTCASTAVTCVITGSSGTTCNDTTNSASVTAGDRITILATPSSTPTARPVIVGLTFEPDHVGEFIFGTLNYGEDLSTTATQYTHMNSGKLLLTTTETDAQQLAQAMTLKKLSVHLDSAPGSIASGKSYTFTLRQQPSGGSAADTSLSCAVADIATTCTNTTDVSIAAGDRLATKIVPSATAPTAAQARISYMGFIDPKRRLTITHH